MESLVVKSEEIQGARSGMPLIVEKAFIGSEERPVMLLVGSLGEPHMGMGSSKSRIQWKRVRSAEMLGYVSVILGRGLPCSLRKSGKVWSYLM